LLLGLVVDDLLGVDGENGDLFGFVGFVSWGEDGEFVDKLEGLVFGDGVDAFGVGEDADVIDLFIVIADVEEVFETVEEF
jgi:hypothetical protein